jgi:hypothetical protein
MRLAMCCRVATLSHINVGPLRAVATPARPHSPPKIPNFFRMSFGYSACQTPTTNLCAS